MIKFIFVPLGWFWIQDSNICETKFNVIQIVDFQYLCNEINIGSIQSLDMIIGSIDQGSMAQDCNALAKDHDIVLKDHKSLTVSCVAFVFQEKS